MLNIACLYFTINHVVTDKLLGSLQESRKTETDTITLVVKPQYSTLFYVRSCFLSVSSTMYLSV